MPATPEARAHHLAEATRAKSVYLASRSPEEDGADWATALQFANDKISDALTASADLHDVAAALQASGSHSLVLRHLTAPPISQDQFALICPMWSKAREKSGSGTPHARAEAVAATFELWRSRALTPWLDGGLRAPTAAERSILRTAVAPLIANQQFQTIQRTRLAAQQEQAVIQLLDRNHWTRAPAMQLDRRGQLLPMHYSYKTKFATDADGNAQEVDLALGLYGVVVLAMECKVSNDKTNSIKRVNDVVKKAAAWREHWGRQVRTAALLQGVINGRDVLRLLDQDVEVFWSHRLADFESWLNAELARGAAAAMRQGPGVTSANPKSTG